METFEDVWDRASNKRADGSEETAHQYLQAKFVAFSYLVVLDALVRENVMRIYSGTPPRELRVTCTGSAIL